MSNLTRQITRGIELSPLARSGQRRTGNCGNLRWLAATLLLPSATLLAAVAKDVVIENLGNDLKVESGVVAFFIAYVAVSCWLQLRLKRH